MLEIDLLSIGFHKGEADFRVSMLAQDLSFGDMQELRAMIPVAIAELEGVWRRRNTPDALQTISEKLTDL